MVKITQIPDCESSRWLRGLERQRPEYLLSTSFEERANKIADEFDGLVAALANFCETVELVDPGVYQDAVSQARTAMAEAGV